MNTVITFRLLLATLLTALLSVSVQAATIQLTYQNNLTGPSGKIIDTNSGLNSNVYAGEFDFAIGAKSPELVQWDDNLSAFCVQTSTTLKSSATYTVFAGLSSFSANQQNLLDHLFSNYYETSQLSAANSAAMQLAIWEIVNEAGSSLSLTGGNFKSDAFGSARTLANQWLTSLASSTTSGLYDFYTLTSSKSQDLITVVRRVDVPEPATLLLLMLGLAALVSARRLRS